MKRTLRLLLTVGLSLVCVSLFAQKFPNYPIPQQPDTLRILGIGNSFTDDGMMYLPELLEAAGIRNVVLGRLYIAGCSLERHCREYAGNAPAYIYYKSTSNRWETVSKKATLLDGIADERWDVVQIGHLSDLSALVRPAGRDRAMVLLQCRSLHRLATDMGLCPQFAAPGFRTIREEPATDVPGNRLFG